VAVVGCVMEGQHGLADAFWEAASPGEGGGGGGGGVSVLGCVPYSQRSHSEVPCRSMPCLRLNDPKFTLLCFLFDGITLLCCVSFHNITSHKTVLQ
jgi:hypothetical protein